MAQSDQNVQNAGFPTVRADINDNLAALFSQSSGSSAPSVTVAFQPWVDTSVSPPLWKVRNASNNAWITIGTLDPAGFGVSGVTPIANGGTGQTTASAALTALLPSQTGNSGKSLTTNGTVASWGTPTASSDKQVFTADGTWTKPSFGSVALITVWGGGGGGGRGSLRASGGGGGGCSQRLMQLSDLPATVSVNVGGGGTGATVSNTDGTAGGKTWFGEDLTDAYVAAGGGNRGRGVSTGSAVGGTGGDSYVGNGGGDDIVQGFGEGANAGNDSAGFGGAGGGGYDASTSSLYSGGEAFYGGAGGGGASTTSGTSKGFSINGGNGGAGTTDAGGDGSAPGGGGGGGITSGGNGGSGRVIVYVW